MPIIPNLIPIMDDEVLTSYLCRLAEANYQFYPSRKGHSAFSGEISFIPSSYIGISPYLENIADQLGIDTMSLLYDHTTFLSDQILKTRLEIKKAVRSMFSYRENSSKRQLLDTEEFYYCPFCAKEDEEARGFHYVHIDHQLSPGFCWKHHCYTKQDTVERFLHADIGHMDLPSVTPPDLTPSLTEHSAYAMKQDIINKRLVIDYEDVVTLIEFGFKPATMFITNSILNLEDQEAIFPHTDTMTQEICLTDAYRYLLTAQKHGFTLALYPNLLSALLAESLNGKELGEVLPPANKIYENCVLSAAKQSYTVLTERSKPIIKVKHITTGQIKYVSLYSVIDGHIDT